MPTELKGQIEHITYNNEENGYTIAKIKVSNRKELVTVVGNILSPTPGEVLIMNGEWTTHPKYGKQFKITHCKTLTPASVYGIEKYLGSGLIKGIGPVMAKRIVEKFGESTLEIIETDINRLTEIEGIGDLRIDMVEKAWEDQKEVRNVMLFLQSHDVNSGHATKIFKRYGINSIKIVKENPFRLATDIFGIGFLTADKIAEKIGFPENSPQRVEAGMLYILHQLSDNGHVYYPYELLIKKSQEVLKVDREIIVKAFATTASDKKIVIEDLNTKADEFSENNKAVYLAKFHQCETSIAALLKTITYARKSTKKIDSKALHWIQTKLSIKLAEKQKDAIKCAIENKAMVITGGPGTGKTTIIKAILRIYSRLGVNIMLAAPTGRAAKRMNEATGLEAKTIHRMLKFSPKNGEFEKNEYNLLQCDLLIIDEASMIDTVLMHHLLKAIPKEATLILVGDVNQLPSVGAGNVLKDIINSAILPVVELNEIFRQAKESLIIVNAHMINSGVLPLIETSDGKLEDFYFIDKQDPEDVLKIIIELTSKRIPDRFGLDPFQDIQVLTPMHRGTVGTANLNMELQQALNPKQAGIIRGGQSFRVNDKVMQIKNNYDKEVFNGDIGRIIEINVNNRTVTIAFDARFIEYDFVDLDEIVLAYAISVHKSQGSEFPAVILPVLTQHFIMLQRNLIYTGVTRGKKLVVIVGTKKAMAIGIKNDKTQKRYTHLRFRLWQNT